jgi:hypothetical protein
MDYSLRLLFDTLRSIFHVISEGFRKNKLDQEAANEVLISRQMPTIDNK